VFFNFFKKDYSHYQERGDRLFNDGRFAEARHEYEEACNLLAPDASSEIVNHLKGKLQSIGNQLAIMNINEAEHSFHSGNLVKALEHAELALEQAEDEVIRGNAKKFIQSIEFPISTKEPKMQSHACGSCSGSHHSSEATSEISTDFLSLNDRYELLIQPLPGDLSERYRQMGERFAYGYIAVHDERVEEGYSVFRELSERLKSDILEYEIAIIDFHAHKLADCEKRLKSALLINSSNPLCHLAMVQLMIETGRLLEAINILQHMIDFGYLADQALIMLGDVLLMMNNVDEALGKYIEALEIPSIAKTAAQKAIPVLDGLGRTSDSQVLAKRYLKGCC